MTTDELGEVDWKATAEARARTLARVTNERDDLARKLHHATAEPCAQPKTKAEIKALADQGATLRVTAALMLALVEERDGAAAEARAGTVAKEFHDEVVEDLTAQLDNAKEDKKATQELLREGREAIEEAWGLIANAGGGDWKTQTPGWQDAAARWRNRYMGPEPPAANPARTDIPVTGGDAPGE